MAFNQNRTKRIVNICPIEVILVSIESLLSVEFQYKKICVATSAKKEFEACEKNLEIHCVTFWDGAHLVPIL